ncbi:3-galactosyl-N-acetylglucosaminide 4-alpha-L-fucosyltransferase FUT3-like [Heteronotia binoei]|uniref:3-galactosyl-N-acetylglucosaminide 4-alpha-L-fucosyltransferase FUT3-like n=1 Tax=Heteronotia binoei TaxID=13085 RepID=UPI002931CD50|nr:3-galactosyl-N-acetylglucosaminide 4-alpha-L-fucosyltransferase FUT3-like [Heteronotia binoei]
MDFFRDRNIPATWLAFTFLLLQGLSVMLFSYVCNSGTTSSPLQPQPAQVPRAPNLTVLLWTWPFGGRFPIEKCSELLGIPDCHITANRLWYPVADAVIVHHFDVCKSPRFLPRRLRPPSQLWIWFNLEPPTYTRNVHLMDNRFNLTMSYRRDSDIFTPYGWLEVLPEPRNVTVPLKTKLVAWVVSKWNPSSLRVRYYQELKKYIHVDVYGYQHSPLPQKKQIKVLSQYKFYLAFENSVHEDYITEKLWKTALLAETVPVVCGPPRKNYELYLPPGSFIHIDDFPTVQGLALFLQELDQNSERYESYFQWRSWLTPVKTTTWSLHLCRACRALQGNSVRYQTVSALSKWFR